MPLRIQNSLTRQKEEFRPLDPPNVRMYVCGPTVYDEPHLGHLRSAYTFDVMRRYLERSGYRVTFVRNVTDVDDKIIEKARQTGGTDLVAETVSVSSRYLSMYKADLRTLGIGEPTHEPKATGHIQEMAVLIDRLLSSGHAYASDGDVYFDVEACAGYGKLSGQKKDSMLDGVRIDPSEKKKSPLDFALWKKARAGEPAWTIQAGGHAFTGRPGWHIECSAMSAKYLGESFDIHGGGRDLIFPHHENEIAQSECANGKPFAKHWVHHGLITVEEQKMSKSLKNYVTLSLARSKWSVDELKLLFLGTHYPAPLDYSEEKMKMEHAVRKRFHYFFDEVNQLKTGASEAPAAVPAIDKAFAAFDEAMNDDFNTPAALAALHELMHKARLSKDPASMLYAGHLIAGACKSVFGLFGGEQEAFFSATGLPVRSGEDASIASAVEEKVRSRAAAKAAKDFQKADAIREELAKQDIELVDLAGGRTVWRRKF